MQHLSEVVFNVLVRFSLYTTSTHHRVKQSPKSTTGMSCVAYVMLCGSRDRSCSQQTIVLPLRQCSSTFLALDLDFFFGKKTRLLCLLTLLIWFSATSCYSRPKAGYFSNNKNPTRALNTTSLKCLLPTTDAIDSREKVHACVWRCKIASCKRSSLKSTRFSQTKGRIIF